MSRGGSNGGGGGGGVPTVVSLPRHEACLDCGFPAHFLHNENHRCVSSIVLKVYCAECGCLQVKHTRLFKFIYLYIVPVYTITP